METRQELTQRNFGNLIRMFAPLYRPTVRVNVCEYCGFSRSRTSNSTSPTVRPPELDAESIHLHGYEQDGKGFDRSLVSPPTHSEPSVAGLV